MIEIIEEARTAERMASNSARMLKIASVVKAWAKVDADDTLTEEQKNIVMKAAMAEVWRIVEGGPL